VIQALDELKKFNPGAREAIKYLEQELKKGNRYNFCVCVCVGAMYSGKYDVCDVTLSVHPHRAG
jgi:hypothetical protein